MKVDKAKLDLVPPEIIYGLAEAFEDGAKKRSSHNWEVGVDAQKWSISDRIAAIQRHALQLQMGHDLAEDSKIHHAAHIAANAAMIYTAYIRGDIGIDDRVKSLKPTEPAFKAKDKKKKQQASEGAFARYLEEERQGIKTGPFPGHLYEPY